MEKIDTYAVVPGLEFLADNPEFLTQENDLLAEHCTAIYIPRAYIPKLLDFQIEHPDDERYPGLLKVLGDVFEQSGESVDRALHVSGQPIIICNIDPNDVDSLQLPHYDQRKHEYQAVSLAHQLQKKQQIAVLTDDDGLRALASSAHIPVIREKRQTYTGRRKIVLPSGNDLNLDYENGFQLSKWQQLFPDESELKPNEFVAFTQEYSNQYHILRYDAKHHRLASCKAKRYCPPIIGEISARNAGQAMILEALLAPVADIPIVILQGDFGTGKTFLTTAVAYAGVESKQFSEIVVCPRDSRLGDDIGAVPGDTFDKTRTKAHSVVDNLREVIKITKNLKPERLDSYVEEVLASYFTFTPLAEVGGRSLARSFIICDEFQDMNRQQARAVMTRIGEDSKLVLMGDLEQINNPRLTPTSCGLAYAIKHLSGKPEIAFINLNGDETTRSSAAKALAKYL